MTTSHRSVLVHNLGHYDLQLLVGNPPVAMKVRSSHTRSASKFLLKQLTDGAGFFCAAQASGFAAGCFQLQTPITLVAQTKDRDEPSHRWVEDTDEPSPKEALVLTGARLALLPPVFSAWAAATPGAHRSAVLVYTDTQDNSDGTQDTVYVASLLKAWLTSLYPLCHEIILLSGLSTSPFRFGDASMNLHHRLNRTLDAVQSDGEVPGKSMSVFLSVSTGTTPTIWSLSSATRPYRPSLVHIPSARTVFPAKRSYIAQVHAYAVHGEVAATPREALKPLHKKLADEMEVYRNEFLPTWMAHKDNVGTLSTFWLRKGQKPVLAVLAVYDSKSGDVKIHRGCNLEVSMPTGSLCAERNAIGSALAANPAIVQSEFLAIAVLGVEHNGPLDPCGVCTEWLLKLSEGNPAFRVLTFADSELTKVLCQTVS